MSRKKINISELNLNKIGGRIALIRDQSGLNQEQFGENIGLSKSNISQIENHIFKPSYDSLVKIIEHYNINPVWLLTGEGEMIRQRNNELQVAEKTSSYNRAEKIDVGGLRKLLIGVQKILERRENEVNILKDLINFLTDREERIREGDPPEKKEDFINMRATSTG